VPLLTFHLRETSPQHDPRKNRCVKRIEAVIKPLKLDGVKDRVLQLGARGMTVSEVRELDHVVGRRDTYRDSTCKVELVRKVRIQIVANDELVDPIVEAIVATTRGGPAGDGRILVSSITDVIRIRTGEHGAEAV
jgi:nitrogen regulatory protein P-II 1